MTVGVAIKEGLESELSLAAQLKSTLATKVATLLPKLITTLIILLIGYFLIKLLNKIVAKFFDKVHFERSIETFLENVIKIALWTILFVILLSNMGVNVSGLIAGLGIMGFIVGFALKDTLGNLAAGIFLLFHRPFKVGDWIKVGSIVGGVQKVGVAACVLNSPDNTKITIPNSKIWGDVIQNFTANKTRKLYNLEIGISYGDNINKAIKIINDVLKKDKRILKDPEPQVVVKELADSSVNIAVRPTIKKEDYWTVYFDLNKKIKEEFDKKGITIPFPQRDVWMKKDKKTKKSA